MDWINDTQRALTYIEDNIYDVTIESAARHVCAASHHFQRIFGVVTGFPLGEYIRLRRLSLAGQELRRDKLKVIDAALKYGYDSPESFSKAFTRFHGVTPSAAREGDHSLKVFAPVTVEINIKGGYVMTRKLIPNVQKLYENPAENFMFPSCMRSAMLALGETGYDFLFFAGVTGDLFTQTWCMPKWQYNDSFSQVCHDSLIPVQEAFSACGYEYEYVPKEEIQFNKAKYVRKIVESVDRGVPVLTLGIVGPPICSIIFGYDENGGVLIGWSQFTDEPKENNPSDLYTSEDYFQVRNGLDRSCGLIFIGKKIHAPSVSESMRASLFNIPKLAHLPETIRAGEEQRVVFGKAAFDKWADSLLDDACFQTEDQLESPLDCYGSCMVQIGTNMHYMETYLKRAAELCPDLEALIRTLEQAYQRVRENLQAISDMEGGYFFDADRKALLNCNFRQKLSELVRALGDRYMEAANVMSGIQS